MMNDTAIAVRSERALVTAQDVLTQVKMVQEVMQAVMKPDVHYGVIPGTQKPSLWKPGAEVLCATFRIADSYLIEDLSTEDAIRYRVACRGTHQNSGVLMGEGIGECSSNEKKYKWVKAYPREYESTPENRRRKIYGFDKQKRQEYEILQVRTDPADVANTILKMAAKRAKIAMVLNVTAASDIFAQDLEDLDERLRGMAEDGDQSGGEKITPERLEELKAALNKVTTKEALRTALKAALGVTAAAKDPEAHAAIKAYGTTIAASLPEAEGTE